VFQLRVIQDKLQPRMASFIHVCGNSVRVQVAEYEMQTAVIIALASVSGALLMLLVIVFYRKCTRAQHAYHRVAHGLDDEEQEFKKVLEMQVRPPSACRASGVHTCLINGSPSTRLLTLHVLFTVCASIREMT
jgi:hypothetical protein